MSDNPPGRTEAGGRFSDLVQRLHALHPRLIDLSLGRTQALLEQLGHPERQLPPVIHVAGTNGKGSTCAFLRAIAEAAGWRVHVFTSPHLVRFTERVVLAGQEVDADTLHAALEEVERVNDGAAITVFELVTVTALLLFARVPAELAVIEVGLGGRYDATNVIPPPAAAAITSISMDHRDFLGDTLARIAGEKAGIIKPGAPAVTGLQDPVAMAVLDEAAAAANVALLARGRDWRIGQDGEGLLFSDAAGVLHLPLPALPGPHQIDNAGIAVAAVRAAQLGLPDSALARGVAGAAWPARLQRLHGRLAALLPDGWELWLDGGHNPGAGLVLSEHIRTAWTDRPLHIVVGMKQSKDSTEFLRPLLPLAAGLWAVAEPGQHLAMPVEAIVAASGGAARAGATVVDALQALPKPGCARVLICGSLYLAGEVLKQDA